jgi:hypothetical protein
VARRAAQRAIVARCARLIAVHVGQLAAGRDPVDHFYGIERIARCARAEWLEAQRELDGSRNRR